MDDGIKWKRRLCAIDTDAVVVVFFDTKAVVKPATAENSRESVLFDGGLHCSIVHTGCRMYQNLNAVLLHE